MTAPHPQGPRQPGPPGQSGQPPQWAPPPWAAAGPPPAPVAGLGAWALLPVIATIATVLSLAVPEHGQSAIDDHLAWAIFAMAAAALWAPILGALARSNPVTGWRIAAAGAGGIAAYWLLIALPAVDTNQGFGLTVGTAAAALGLWLAPGRPH